MPYDRVHMPEPRESTLAAFLAEAFSEDELRRWVHGTLGPKAYRDLPGTGTSLNEIAFQAALLVSKYGCDDEVLFESLHQERPGLEARIRAVAEHWSAVSSAKAPTPRPQSDIAGQAAGEHRVAGTQGTEHGARSPRVFISYSHDSLAHEERTLELADRLRREGVDAWLDRYEPHPPEGWPVWMQTRIEQADFILLVCTPTYRRRFERRETSGQGKGVTWEALFATQILYEARGHNERLIPVIFGDEEETAIPLALRGYTYYRLDSSYEALYRQLTGQPEVEAPSLGPQRALPSRQPRSDGMAGRGPMPARADTEDDARLLRDEARQRLSRALTDATQRKQRLEEAGTSTAGIVEEIIELKRSLRRGGLLRQGDRLSDRYLLIDQIGRGGFAWVWEALDERTGERVALKVMHSDVATDRTRRRRFFRGARIMAELAHRSVLPIRELEAEDEGVYYFVMDLVPGGDLRRAVLDKRVSSRDAVPLILQVGEAVAEAHRRGYLHRDIKPANILLTDAGAPLLTDFDLAAAEDTTGGTRTGAMGTFLYAAPEMLSHPQNANARADVFGLGMTAIFVLYGADLPPQVMRDTETFIQGLDCAPAVAAVLERATAWRVDDRYRDAGAFCSALKDAAAAERAFVPERPHGRNRGTRQSEAFRTARLDTRLSAARAETASSKTPDHVRSAGKRKGWLIGGAALGATVLFIIVQGPVVGMLTDDEQADNASRRDAAERAEKPPADSPAPPSKTPALSQGSPGAVQSDQGQTVSSEAAIDASVAQAGLATNQGSKHLTEGEAEVMLNLAHRNRISNPDSALKLYRQVVAQGPKGPVRRSAYLGMAKVAWERKDWDAAISHARLAGDSVEVHRLLGNANFRKGNIPQARFHYQKVMERDPNDSTVRALLDKMR
jgi:tetratricopeptide (TPR) repeat protein